MNVTRLKKLGSSWRGSDNIIVDAAHCEQVGGCYYYLHKYGNECYTVDGHVRSADRAMASTHPDPHS